LGLLHSSTEADATGAGAVSRRRRSGPGGRRTSLDISFSSHILPLTYPEKRKDRPNRVKSDHNHNIFAALQYIIAFVFSWRAILGNQ